MKGLTKKQTEILDFINEFLHNHRYAPTYQEISDHFSYSSKGTVHNHIKSLKKKGILQITPPVSRSISPTNPPAPKTAPYETTIPLAGYITAHNGIKTFSTVRTVNVPTALVTHPDSTYALSVQGSSFSEELINDGDVVIVEARQMINPGETVVALIDKSETAIRRYYSDGNNIKLVGVQLAHSPLLVSSDSVTIQGVVVGLIRTYG